MKAVKQLDLFLQSTIGSTDGRVCILRLVTNLVLSRMFVDNAIAFNCNTFHPLYEKFQGIGAMKAV